MRRSRIASPVLLSVASVALGTLAQTTAHPPLPAPPATVPSAPTPTYRALQTNAAAPCAVEGLLAQIGAGCHRVVPSRVAASGAGTSDPAAASDGNACTIWNAGGFPPQSVELDLQGASVAGFVFITEMTPSAFSTHVIETSSAGEPWSPRFTAPGGFMSGAPWALLFPSAIVAQRWRVRTVSSPSWVAWRDVFAFECPPGSLTSTTTAPAPRIVPGDGSCLQDRDCLPNRCCQPTTCVAHDGAPNCGSGSTCPAVAGIMDVPGSACVCSAGRCAARIGPSAAAPPPSPIRSGASCDQRITVGGRGACSTDADCVPNACCQPDSCVARAEAPRCPAHALCPMMMGPMSWPGTGCLCRNRRCAAHVRAGCEGNSVGAAGASGH